MVGGATAGLTSSLNQRAQARTAQLGRDLTRRESLFRDFITAASKAYGQAVATSEPNVEDLAALYAMISSMRILPHPELLFPAPNGAYCAVVRDYMHRLDAK
jgi:hypothetical protein